MKLIKSSATVEDLAYAPSDVIPELLHGELFHRARRDDYEHVWDALTETYAFRGVAWLGAGQTWDAECEPRLHLRGDVLVPAGCAWRCAGESERPRDHASSDGPRATAPTWVCELLRDGSEAITVDARLQTYLKAGVEWVWLLDAPARRLTVFHSQRSDAWTPVCTVGEKGTVRLPPFAIDELVLEDLWWSPDERCQRLRSSIGDLGGAIEATLARGVNADALLLRLLSTLELHPSPFEDDAVTELLCADCELLRACALVACRCPLTRARQVASRARGHGEPSPAI